VADALHLGVDAGGTRSTALLVDGDGIVRGRADGGSANYQAIGKKAAERTLHDLVAEALRSASLGASDVISAAYGIAGADRPKDFTVVEGLLPSVAPGRRILVNDAELALRAGTDDGVGIAVVSGTGSNAIGRSADGSVEHVGGFCFELGDFGSAVDLGREAIRLAMRGKDGRGAPTALYARICQEIGVDPLEDILDLWMQNAGRATDSGRLAPLVFEVAAEGDAVARALLERAGLDLALSARVLLERLFAPTERPTIVLGGSVLQRPADPTMVRAFVRDVRATRPIVNVVRLTADPVVGAVLLAHDRVHPNVELRAAFREKLRGTSGDWTSPVVA
jgi:N-acetylglucosamine kinase-like BadF-type ATPase